MSHLAIVVSIVGAFVLTVVAFKAVKAYLENRGEEAAPFRNYFGPEYDRDLLRQSSWCDDEKQIDRRTRIDAFDTRERGATERHSIGSGTARRNRDRD
jgi:hypothetical protein